MIGGKSVIAELDNMLAEFDWDQAFNADFDVESLYNLVYLVNEETGAVGDVTCRVGIIFNDDYLTQCYLKSMKELPSYTEEMLLRYKSFDVMEDILDQGYELKFTDENIPMLFEPIENNPSSLADDVRMITNIVILLHYRYHSFDKPGHAQDAFQKWRKEYAEYIPAVTSIGYSWIWKD